MNKERVKKNTTLQKQRVSTRSHTIRSGYRPRTIHAVGLGGGRGLMHVTFPAFRELGWTSTLSVTTFGTGGSSLMIKELLEPFFGYTFSVGNLAAAYTQALERPEVELVFGHRIDWDDRRRLFDIVEDRIESLNKAKQIPAISRALFNRLCRIAKTIDHDLQTGRFGPTLNLYGHSIQNLVLLWHLLRFGVFRSRNQVHSPSLGRALAALQKFFGLRSPHILPVSVEPGVLVARYSHAISSRIARETKIPSLYWSKSKRTIIGEYYIDILNAASPIQDFSIVHPGTPLERRTRQPSVYPAVRNALRQAKIIVAGGGSFYTSILANLAVGGVLDELLLRQDVPRILILNPYHLNQTVSHRLHDFTQRVETLARRVVSDTAKEQHGGRIAFKNLFSDVIINDATATRKESKEGRRILYAMNAKKSGEARGPIPLTREEKQRIRASGVFLHSGHFVGITPKDVKAPRGDVFHIAGYKPTNIARVFHKIAQRFES